MSIRKGQYFIAGMPSKITRSVGQIIQSIVPLDDLELRLLDGSIISGDGIYSDFVNYIKSLMTEYPHFFVSESDWQNYVNRDGVCARFVYDATNNTLRLPKITGFIEGTNSTSDLGNLVNAGLPNITGDVQIQSPWTNASENGALKTTTQGGSFVSGQTSQTWTNRLYFDASHSNSIYGNSSTVQPQSIKVLYYIVVANSTKTDFTINIDKVEDRLNAKANDIDVVHKTGDETITGDKIFTGALTIPAFTVITKEQVAGRENEGGELQFEVGTNSPLLEPIHVDVYEGRFRVFGTASDGVTKEIINADIENNNLRAPASDSLNSVITTTGISKSANGYVKLGNGITIQWGNAGSGGTITFPTPFSSDNFSVTATIKSANGTNDNDAITGKRTTSFDFHNYSGGGCLWIAIGY